jgi:hypothetical protein
MYKIFESTLTLYLFIKDTNESFSTDGSSFITSRLTYNKTNKFLIKTFLNETAENDRPRQTT